MLTSEFQSRCAACKPQCVEVALRDGVILVMDSKNPQGTVLEFDRDEWSNFIYGAKDGQFDLPDLTEQPTSVPDGALAGA